MATQSSIEWTEQTWNPVTGCIKVSPGCKHCYAEKLAKRLEAMGTPGYTNGFKNVTLLPERLDQPRKRRKPTIYFVNSMSDLFQDGVPFSFVDKIMDVIRDTPQHTYQILTKRAARMRKYFAKRKVPVNAGWVFRWRTRSTVFLVLRSWQRLRLALGFYRWSHCWEDIGTVDLTGIHWVIVGGESGHKARPMKQEWVIGVADSMRSSGGGLLL